MGERRTGNDGGDNRRCREVAGKGSAFHALRAKRRLRSQEGGTFHEFVLGGCTAPSCEVRGAEALPINGGGWSLRAGSRPPGSVVGE